MAGATVRISEGARKSLKALAAKEGKSMQTILDDAIEAYRRRQMLRDFNSAYAVLRQDPQAWAEIQRERASWDATLTDGLEAEERWDEQGRVHFSRRKQK